MNSRCFMLVHPNVHAVILWPITGYWSLTSFFSRLTQCLTLLADFNIFQCARKKPLFCTVLSAVSVGFLSCFQEKEYHFINNGISN